MSLAHHTLGNPRLKVYDLKISRSENRQQNERNCALKWLAWCSAQKMLMNVPETSLFRLIGSLNCDQIMHLENVVSALRTNFRFHKRTQQNGHRKRRIQNQFMTMWNPGYEGLKFVFLKPVVINWVFPPRPWPICSICNSRTQVAPRSKNFTSHINSRSSYSDIFHSRLSSASDMFGKESWWVFSDFFDVQWRAELKLESIG